MFCWNLIIFMEVQVHVNCAFPQSIGPNHSLLAHFDIGHPPWLALITGGAVLEFTATSSSVLWTWGSLA